MFAQSGDPVQRDPAGVLKALSNFHASVKFRKRDARVGWRLLPRGSVSANFIVDHKFCYHLVTLPDILLRQQNSCAVPYRPDEPSYGIKDNIGESYDLDNLSVGALTHETHG